jgi:hypothetical protein
MVLTSSRPGSYVIPGRQNHSLLEEYWYYTVRYSSKTANENLTEYNMQ